MRDNAEAEINIDYYSTQQDVFSRNQGIVEKDRMAAKRPSFPAPDDEIIRRAYP